MKSVAVFLASVFALAGPAGAEPVSCGDERNDRVWSRLFVPVKVGANTTFAHINEPTILSFRTLDRERDRSFFACPDPLKSRRLGRGDE